MNSQPQIAPPAKKQANSESVPFNSCAIVLLLVIAFLMGGLLGGMGGAALVLWAVSEQVGWNQSDAPPAPVSLSTPTPSATATESVTPTASPTVTPTPPPATATPSLADAVSRVMPAVVTIVNHQAGLQRFGASSNAARIRGSGTIVDARGYIVTNFHVVEGANQLVVILADERELVGRVVASDAVQDIALVHVDDGHLTTATWGDSNRVRPGEWAIAIGSALGDFPNSVTLGIVSGVDRALEVNGEMRVGGLIQTDAAINKGNSGGPLINQYGEVIGINTFIIREAQSTGVAEGIGFAIPSSRARPVVEAWIAADIR